MKSTRLYFVLRSFYIVFLTSSIIACNNSESSPAAKNDASAPLLQQSVFDKLTGTWKGEDGKSFERWTKNDNGTYRSEGFSIKGNDTSWNEQAAIYEENDHWVFENTVKNQNEGKAVKFASSLLTDNSVHFSNPAHDFPTDINYTVADAITLRAFIVGPDNKGGKDTIPFKFTRIK